MSDITKNIKIKGMHCTSCKEKIEHDIHKLEGIKSIDVDIVKETGRLTFDSDKLDMNTINRAIESSGYECSLIEDPGVNENAKVKSPVTPDSDDDHYYFNTKYLKWLGLFFGIAGLLVGGYFILRLVEGINMPAISEGMSLGLLFVVGLLTGFHCVAMCGGFVVSYTANDAKAGKKSYKSHLKYGLGKTISYTVIGAAFGLVGSIFAFTPLIRGIAGIIAGLFLLIFGLNMFGVFPWLRKFRLKTPKFIQKFVRKESSGNSSPLIVGLLNGLMIACGPLQAIYIMAAGTGSALEGAKLLFVFALGTLPVMLGFGYLTTLVSSKMTRKILKASGVIVIILGLIMINRGLSLTGTGYDVNTLIGSASASNNEITGNAISLDDGYQTIRMNVTRYGWEPDSFVLKKGVPVKWIINGLEVGGCNNAIQVPKLGLKFDIKKGEQTIEFTPTDEGVIPWSCWMGMIPGTFIVKEDIDVNNAEEVQKELDAVPVQAKGSCGGSCGSPTCGSSGSSCGCGG